MNSLVVFDSLYGNTATLAQAIAEACGARGPVTLRRAGDPDALRPDGADVVFVGGPTHRQGPSPVMAALLEATAPDALNGVRLAVFDTCYVMPEWLRWLSRGTAAAKIGRALLRRGAVLLVPPESFLIEHGREGPLLLGELERARSWAGTVLEEVERREPV